MITAAEMLPALLLAVVIVLLAVPTQFGEPKDKRVMTNIEFCVDVSEWGDIEYTPIEREKCSSEFNKVCEMKTERVRKYIS